MPTKPTRFVLLIPSDSGYDDNFKQGAVSEVTKWIGQAKDWFIRDIGQTFDHEFQRIDSTYTLARLQTGIAADSCGDGAAYPWVLQAVNQVTGWFNQREDPYRIYTVMLRAGGWAGSLFQQKQGKTPDQGWSILGDWELYKGVLGVSHPCNPWPDLQSGSSFGHELLNCMGAKGDPAVSLNDVIPPAVAADIKAASKSFLRRP